MRFFLLVVCTLLTAASPVAAFVPHPPEPPSGSDRLIGEMDYGTTSYWS